MLDSHEVSDRLVILLENAREELRAASGLVHLASRDEILHRIGEAQAVVDDARNLAEEAIRFDI